MSWQDEFKTLTERKVMGITKGMAKQYAKMASENTWHTCEDCQLCIGKYPGNYPKHCSNCGCDMSMQKTYPRKPNPQVVPDEEPIMQEAYTLREKKDVFRKLNDTCAAIHEGYSMVPWSPNHRVVAPVIVENGHATFGVYAPYREAQGKVVGSFKLDLSEAWKWEVELGVEKFLNEYAAKSESLTLLPKTLQESTGIDPKTGDHFTALGSPGNTTNGSGMAGLAMGEDDDEEVGEGGHEAGLGGYRSTDPTDYKMEVTESDDRDNIEKKLNNTGVKWKWGQKKTGHWIVIPKSNIKPFTPEEERKLISAVEGMPGGLVMKGSKPGPGTLKITRKGVTSKWREKGMSDGYGFRIFVESTDEQMGSTNGPEGSGSLTQKMGTHNHVESGDCTCEKCATDKLGESFMKELSELVDGTPSYGINNMRQEKAGTCSNCGEKSKENVCRNCRNEMNRPDSVPANEGVFNDRSGGTTLTAGVNEARFQVTVKDSNNQNKMRAFEVTASDLTSAIHRVQQNKNHEVVAAIPLLESSLDGVSDDSKDVEGYSKYRAVATIIFNEENEFLVGRAKTDDDRDGKLCFPGGGIDDEDGKDPAAAAKREAYEEMGVQCLPTGHIIEHPDKPDVAFCICTYSTGNPEVNDEFSSFAWIPYEGRFAYQKELYPVNMAVLERIPPGIIRSAEEKVEESYLNLPGFKRSDAKFVQQLWFRGDWAESNMGRADKRRAQRLSENEQVAVREVDGEVFYQPLEETGDLISQAIFEAGASAIGSRKITGGKPADPDPRAAPGTSMKEPEKETPMTIPPKKAPTLTPPATEPDETGDLPSPDGQPGDEEQQQGPESQAKDSRMDQWSDTMKDISKKPKAGPVKQGQVPDKAAMAPPAQAPQPTIQQQPAVQPPVQQPDAEQQQMPVQPPAPKEQPQQAQDGGMDPAPEGQSVDPKQDPAAQAPVQGAVPTAGEAPQQQSAGDAAGTPSPAPGPAQPGQQGQAVDPNQQVPQDPAQQQAAVDPVTRQPVQQPVQATVQTVDLVLGSDALSQQAFDWLSQLGVNNLHRDGTTIRVSASTGGEADLIARVAKAFGLELSGLSNPGPAVQPQQANGGTPVQ